MSLKLKKIQQKIIAFCDEREWNQFHNPKDLAISLALEAAEVLEHVQWKDGKDLMVKLTANKEDVSDEIADVAIYLLELCYVLDIDLLQSIEKKLAKNAQKYPIEKAKGNAKKYTEF